MNVDQANNNAGYIDNGNTNGYGITFGSGSGEGIASERVAGANQYGLDFYTSFTQRMSLNNSGNLMLNGNDLYLLAGNTYNGLGYRTSVAGVSPSGGDGLFLYGLEAGYLGTRDPDAVALWWDWHNNVAVTGEYLVVNGLTPVYAYIGDDGSGNDVQIGSQKSGVTALAAYNTADSAYMHFYCSSITIEGGADLAEPFKIAAGENEVPQGAVVVIDEQNPGRLKISDQRYDTHVAGVVSGANGINPGIQMQQQGLLEGGKNVALTGRVYVQADTSNGAIKPGDLLTTSSAPGCAITVMAQNNGGTTWYRLMPDSQGSYVNGIWTNNIAAMHDSRTFFSSDVLQNGQVLVAGGEYGSGGAKAEVYDPVANDWTPTPVAGVCFADSQSRILPGGDVLVAPVSWVPYPAWVTFLFNPYANSWTEGPTNLEYQDEASWVKLPDDSIVTLDPFGHLSSERYIPALNQWIADAIPPVQLFSNPNTEIGAGHLLAGGKAFFLGGTGQTLYYTPTGDHSPGSWAQGPDIPFGLVAQDAPSAMMCNGKILCEVSSASNHTPVYFDEYDPVSRTFAQTSSPGDATIGSSLNTGSDNSYMLDLPDGSVLYSYTSAQLYVYHPDGSPLTSGKPTIFKTSWNSDGSVHITGTLLNGISEGASYGDDAQMATSYPLARFTDGSGNVYYGRTYNWSSTSIQTGGAIETTEVTVPATVFTFPGAYSLQVVANGIASDPITFYGPVWVDFNYVGLQFGWYPFPYNTLAQGISAVATGGSIVIKSSASHEIMTISKPMTISSVYGPSTIGH